MQLTGDTIFTLGVLAGLFVGGMAGVVIGGANEGGARADLDAQAAMAKELEEARIRIAELEALDPLVGIGEIRGEMRAALAAAETRAEAAEGDNAAMRVEWCLLHVLLVHGSIAAMYGDDGEASCNACGIDFKREPVEQIRQRLLAEGMKRARAARPEGASDAE